MSFTVRIILILSIILLSLISSFGYISNSQNIINFGKLSGLSPLPRPFRDLGSDHENFNSVSKIFSFKNGIATDQTEKVKTIFLSDRPHRSKIMYFKLSNYGYVFSSHTRESILQNLCIYFPNNELISETFYPNVNETIKTRVICN